MLYSHFVGRIGKDGAKVIEGINGKFLSMDVATDYYSKGENKTMWIRVRSNKERYVEKMAPYLTKGSLIIVEGQQLTPSTWIGKDGEAHAQNVVVADLIDFVRTGRKKEENNGAQDNPQDTTPQQEPMYNPTTDAPFPAPEDNVDDAPPF